MKAKIEWRAKFPQGDESSKTKFVPLEPNYNVSIIEKDALLGTPDGYYLYKIDIPYTVLVYSENGEREVTYYKQTSINEQIIK